MHPRTHFTSVRASHCQFLCVILNGDTIDLANIIYRIMVFCSTTSFLSSLHYNSLITQWETFMFLDVGDTAKDR